LILSVILTGIGDDGINAVKELSTHGAKCLTEGVKSAIVDGMPSRARKEVPNIEILELDEIVQKIKEFSH
jgi:two-component system chemotaxis response regulator CheB